MPQGTERAWGWRAKPKWLQASSRWAEAASRRVAGNRSPEEDLKSAERVLSWQIRLNGPDGGPTANARADVASAMEAMGRFDEAVPLRREVLDAERRHRDEDASEVLGAEAWLALCLRNAGEIEEAKRLAGHVLEVRRRDLGPDHEFTARAEALLASMR